MRASKGSETTKVKQLDATVGFHFTWDPFPVFDSAYSFLAVFSEFSIHFSAQSFSTFGVESNSASRTPQGARKLSHCLVHAEQPFRRTHFPVLGSFRSLLHANRRLYAWPILVRQDSGRHGAKTKSVFVCV